MENVSDKKVQEAFKKLEILYSKIPETCGCIENLPKCKGYCCSVQTPKLLYVEFLYTWNYILQRWFIDDILNLIETAVFCYASNAPTKGCIFFDHEKKLCKQHETRCFNCYIYGITPKEDFAAQYEKMKEEYKDKIGVIIKDQCKLVSTVDGSKVTSEDTDLWWDELVKIEESIGIKKEDIYDNIRGTYRTYHDHLLSHLLPRELLVQLFKLRMTEELPTDKKEECLFSFVNTLRISIKKMLEGNR